MDEPESRSSDSGKVVVVSGDVLMEWRLAQSTMRNRVDNDGLFDPFNYMEIYQKPVGAMSVGEIIKRTLAGLPPVSPGKPKPRTIVPNRRKFDNLPYGSPYWHSYVVCAKYPKHDGSDDVVWRVKQKLGIDRKNQRRKLKDLVPDDDGNASLIVIEHSNQGFTRRRSAWPKSLLKPNRPDCWLLLEWTRPKFDKRSKFWAEVSRADRFGGRIVIVVTAEDLRLAGMRISRSQSWERTMTDLYYGLREVWCTETVIRYSPLKGCATMIVSFGTSGAAVFSAVDGRLEGKLIYDPSHVEGGWAGGFDGLMSGFTRCLTAGVAVEMLRQSGAAAFEGDGIKAGVIAARRMLENGFDAYGKLALTNTDLPRDLHFPAADIAGVLRTVIAESESNPELLRKLRSCGQRLQSALMELVDRLHDAEDVEKVVAAVRGVLSDEDVDIAALDEEVRRIYRNWIETVVSDRELRTLKEVKAVPAEEWERRNFVELVKRITRFVSIDDDAIRTARGFCEQDIDINVLAPNWSILERRLPSGGEASEEANRIVEDYGRKIVEDGGIDGPWPFPTARIGKLFITNRFELESLTAVHDLMRDYARSSTASPLSIAVFGPPGSGKSFAINELAAELPQDRFRRVESRTFNLSQFSGPEAIASALQQVRDDGLSGRMPLVFWDEFDTTHDSAPLGWLRYFLAPMQDGKFQDESMLHYVGRAIFVFAGGTYGTMDDFIEKNKDDEKPERPFTKIATDAKVPDFISRLTGFVNIPTLDYVKEPGDGGKLTIDAAKVLRRANLLRSFLARETTLEETVLGESDGREPVLRKRLNIDAGVVAAFLRVERYRYGARSMEAIVKMSALSGKDRYDRSMLPPFDQLNLHVNATAFLKLANAGWSVKIARSRTEELPNVHGT